MLDQRACTSILALFPSRSKRTETRIGEKQENERDGRAAQHSAQDRLRPTGRPPFPPECTSDNLNQKGSIMRHIPHHRRLIVSVVTLGLILAAFWHAGPAVSSTAHAASPVTITF